jgi:predicted dehydrogenase
VNVAIIGCGFIGHKRAAALAGCRLVACADVVWERAEALARLTVGTRPMTDWREVVARRDVDIVIICTTHEALAQIALAAVSAGKHVLVEKPGARRAVDLIPLREAAQQAGVLVRVGFNHRYHPAIRQAKMLCDAGAVGALLYVRGRYGHGGRLGYEREWRANPALSGGGELIDQGAHLIDLARWFLGDFIEIHGFAHTYYWNMPVEDNGFLLLKTSGQQIALLHASWTEWKNLFSLEIFGHQGKLDIAGLGGSYGVERLTYYRMLPEMGPPETMIWEYPQVDTSWGVEFAEFLEDIQSGRSPAAGLSDAEAALQIIECIYKKDPGV